MMNLKFVEKLFILLFLGFSLCVVQACDDDEKLEENTLNLIGVWEYSYNGGYDLYQFNKDGTGKGATSNGVNWTFRYDLNSETLKLVYTKENELAEIWNIESISSSSIKINGEWILSRTNKKIDDIEEKPQSQYEAVDLGLSVKWATCNVGASSPEEIGDYFAWGETEPKNDYSWETYKWSLGTNDTMTKYCTDSYYGTVDNKTMLESSDDVATVRCGSDWRMPSQMEWRELYEQCTWSRIKNGYKVVGPNGKSIFLPLGGTYEGTILEEYDEDGNLHGQYWAYSLGYEDGDEDFDNNDASRFFMANEMADCYFGDADRCCGLNVRAVQEKGGIVQNHKWVDLGLSVKWATCNVGATSPEEYGDYYAWGETTTKSDYDWDTYKWCKGTYYTMTKYCTDSYFGTVDNRTTLTSSDDVATVKWGSKWRMPTKEEMKELVEGCTWKWTTQNGVNGRKVTGPNGNSIFLPSAGYCDDTGLSLRDSSGIYWSATLYYEEGSCCAYFFFLGNAGYDWDYRDRIYGHTVRPVTE